jgi:glycopeptide antibiotics resistance protein
VRLLSKLLLAAYTATLLWLLLFKFSVHFASVLHDDSRSINLIPFSHSSGSAGEIVDNLLVFLPFGLLLGVNCKRLELWRKLLAVFVLSLTVEVVQYILAIGVSDITDVITNTLGGLLGLMVYDLARRHMREESLDRLIVTAGTVLLAIFLLLLAALELHHGVRYHSPRKSGS